MGKNTLTMDRIRRDSDDDIRGERDDNEKFDSNLVSDYERSIESEFDGSRLPDPPNIEGYKMCWLSTTNKNDPIARRLRIGYELVTAKEVPGWDIVANEKLGGYEGYVTCAEMVLSKIQNDKYQVIMALMHHKKPLQQETGIVDMYKEIGQHRRIGGDNDGVAQMEAEARELWKAPKF